MRGGCILRFAEAESDFGICNFCSVFQHCLSPQGAGRIQPLHAFRRARLEPIKIQIIVIIIIKIKASKNSKLDFGMSKFESGASRAFERWRRDFLGRPGARYSTISVFWAEIGGKLALHYLFHLCVCSLGHFHRNLQRKQKREAKARTTTRMMVNKVVGWSLV